ncbi:MAG: GGDEF domain-containing protein [Immundisolibacter sp.]
MALAVGLASNLDLQPLLAQFSRSAGDFVPHDSLGFRHTFAGEEHTVLIGAPARHTCSYQLTVEDTSLGTLSVTRRRRFEETELAMLEQLLSILVYPLRNALLYYRAQHEAATDRLTGLSNRSAFNEAMAREVSRALRYGSGLTLLMADLDNLKLINDRHGHSAGDRALQQVAQALRGALRDSDQVFRYAGDEFAVLLIGGGDDAARAVAERLRARVADLSPEPVPVRPTLSIGLSSLRADDDARTLFERADAALYAAKRAGRDCVCSAP